MGIQFYFKYKYIIGFYYIFLKKNSVDVFNGAKKMQVEKRNEPDPHHNYFIRPNENILAAYLQYHPQIYHFLQPKRIIEKMEEFVCG